MELSHYGVEAMPKPESFPIDKIYVPVKRKKALKPELVQEIAESILEIASQRNRRAAARNGRRVLSTNALTLKPGLEPGFSFRRARGGGEYGVRSDWLATLADNVAPSYVQLANVLNLVRTRSTRPQAALIAQWESVGGGRAFSD